MPDDVSFVPFEPVDHTADLAFVARGRTLPELFVNAAHGMLQFLYDQSTIREDSETRMEVEGADLEELLVAWLQEILYLLEIRGRAFRAIRVEALRPPVNGEPARLTAIGSGEAWDSSRHVLFTQVKAATYHALEIIRESAADGEIYRVCVVLDI